MFDPNQLNGLSLAFLGDTIYESYIREYVIRSGYSKVNQCHKESVKYTSGMNQARFIRYFLANNILTDEEINIYKRGRNSHINSNRKNITLADYLDATGFEAVIGYLAFNKRFTRIEELVNIIINLKEE